MSLKDVDGGVLALSRKRASTCAGSNDLRPHLCLRDVASAEFGRPRSDVTEQFHIALPTAERYVRPTAEHDLQLLQPLQDDSVATQVMHQQQLVASDRGIRNKGRWQPANAIPTHGLPGGTSPSTTTVNG